MAHPISPFILVHFPSNQQVSQGFLGISYFLSDISIYLRRIFSKDFFILLAVIFQPCFAIKTVSEMTTLLIVLD